MMYTEHHQGKGRASLTPKNQGGMYYEARMLLIILTGHRFYPAFTFHFRDISHNLSLK